MQGGQRAGDTQTGGGRDLPPSEAGERISGGQGTTPGQQRREAERPQMQAQQQLEDKERQAGQGQDQQSQQGQQEGQDQQGQDKEGQQGREKENQQGEEEQKPEGEQTGMEERLRILERERTTPPQAKPIDEVIGTCRECTGALAGFMSPDRIRKIARDGPVTLLVPNNEAVRLEANVASTSLRLVRDSYSFPGLGEREQESMLKRHVLKGTVKQLEEGEIKGLIDTKNVTRSPG